MTDIDELLGYIRDCFVKHPDSGRWLHKDAEATWREVGEDLNSALDEVAQITDGKEETTDEYP